MRATANIAQQFMAMIRAKDDLVISTITVTPACLLGQNGPHQINHIGITIKMGSLLKRSVSILCDIAQMGEMNAGCKLARNLRHIIIGASPKRATA